MTTRKIIVGKCVALLLFSLFSAALAPAYGEERNARYELSATVPEAQIRALKNAGWDDEKIGRFSAVYERYRLAHAFVRLPNSLPGEHLLLLAEWINAVTGHEIDPYLIAAIHRNEVFLDVEIGSCTFYPREDSGKRVLKSEVRQRLAFDEIISDINKSPRFKNITPAYPVVSCKGAMGYFQILPTTWLHYKEAILEKLSLLTASPYELLPSILAANLILTDMTRYLNYSPHEVTFENSLYFAQVATAYNAGATSANDFVNKYGIAVYETAREMRDANK